MKTTAGESLHLSTNHDSGPGRRQQLLTIASGAIEAARPGPALQAVFADDADAFWNSCRRQGYGLLAIGKAAEPMAVATINSLGVPHRGMVVTHAPTGSLDPGSNVEQIGAGHPVPNVASLRAGQRLVELIESLPPTMAVVILISGGASALCEKLKPGIDLDALTTLNQALLRSGLAIDQVNVIRQAVSEIKGGGLSRILGARPHRGLLISDVVGNDLSSIGSGLLTAPIWRKGDPWQIATESGLNITSPTITGYLKNGQPRLSGSADIQIIADSNLVAQKARELGQEFGLNSRIVTTALQGNTNDSVTACLVPGPEALSIYCGETTLEVTGEGLGGRNQHAALLSSLSFTEQNRIEAAIMVGTDGRDGPTDAAGAVVDRTTVERATNAGFAPIDCLARFDSHPCLAAAGDVITAQPTGTNVGDLWMFYRGE